MMMQFFAAILFMGALVVSLGVIIASFIEHGDRIAAALRREAQPARVVQVRSPILRLSAPRRSFGRGPTRQQLLRAAA